MLPQQLAAPTTRHDRRAVGVDADEGEESASPAGDQIAGFWLWDVRSLDEAVEWASRAPFNSGGTLELRPLISAEDFGEAFTPELQQQEQRLRAQLEG